MGLLDNIFSGRGILGHDPLTAAQDQPVYAGPQASAGGNLVAGFSNFSDPRLGLIARLINAGQGFATGQRTDPMGMAQAQQQAILGALQQRGVPQADAVLAASSPEMMKALLPRLWPTYAAHNVGDVAGSFNPATGDYRPQYQAPKYEKVGAGEKLVGVGGGSPFGGQPGREIASGGPDKAPAGYEWVDPNNKAAGLRAIQGGPEAKFPANEAANLAMMDSSRLGVENAKKFFLSPNFKSGPINAAGAAVGQALNAGDIGRAQRDIKMAAEAALRMMTGAAAPESEVKRYADMFTPSVYDSLATRQQKLNNLENFMNRATEKMTSGRAVPQSGWVAVGNGIKIREKQ